MQNYPYPNQPYVYGSHPQQQQHYPTLAPAPVASRSHSSRYDPAAPPTGTNYPLAPNGPPVIPAAPVTTSVNGLAHRPRHLADRSASDPTKKPLKSAMRNATSSSGNGTPAVGTSTGTSTNRPMQRSRTVPVEADPYHRGRAMEMKAAPELSRGHSASGTERSSVRGASLPRVRSRSRARRNYTPGHLILALSGKNRMKLSSVVYEGIVDDIRERVLTMWPDGLLFQTYRDDTNEFVVRFYGNPWTATGDLGVMAMKMILELFAVLGRQGYMCTSAIDTGRLTSSPKLVFTVIQPDPVIEFSMIVFSSSKRKIKLINHKDHFCRTLVDVLRDAFPRSVKWAGDEDRHDRFRIDMELVDFDRNSDLLSAAILQHATLLGLRLEGAIPLSHSGLFSFMHGKRELWIFRGLQPFAPGLA